MTVKRDEKGENPQIHCDVCDRPAPPGEEIIAGFGLNNMGWRCSGGKHLCPDHAGEPVEKPKAPPLAETRISK